MFGARSRPGIVLLASVLVTLATGVAEVAGAEPKTPILGLGYEYDLSGAREEFLLPDPLDDPSIAPDHPLYLRLHVPWRLLEPRPGAFDWSEADRIIEPYRAARYAVTLCLYGANPLIDPDGGAPGPDRPETLRRWLEFTRAAALHFRGRVRAYEIWDEPNREPAWPVEHVDRFAYLLKQTSVTIRSADPGALVAEGGLAIAARTAEDDIRWQEALYAQDVATYVDILPIHPPAGEPLGRAVARVSDLLLERDPSAQLVLDRVAPQGATDRERAADLLRSFIVGQGEGAAVVSFDLEADGEGRPEFPAVLLDIHKLFIPSYQRVTGGHLRFDAVDPGGAPPAVTAYRFYDADASSGLVAFFSPAPPAAGRARLTVDTAAVRGAATYDIVGGAAGPAVGAAADFKTNTTVIPTPLLDRPVIVQYARVPIKGFEAEREQVATRDTGLITAEEVIAGHQAFMTDQKYRLQHYQADALLTYHGKIAGSNTIDISYDNTFFWDPATGAEWRQRALFYNGVRWRGKKLPDLPIPQPEKVFTLPLDIHLDKNYTYRYVGRERVGDYDCYVVDFKPIDRTRALYEGRAFVETRTFALVRTTTVETGLAPPLVSNEETDTFAPFAGPDGTTYWLLARVDGQQVLTFAGQNLVLLRDIDFTNLKINDGGFEAARQEAYRSDDPMLRDTDKGLRYLQRNEAGERVVRESLTTTALLGFAGLYRQAGLEYPVVPLLGAGYFNFGFHGKESQMTALLGGAVNFFSMTDPRAFGRRLDATIQAVVFAIALTDQPYVRGERREESNLDVRPQSVTGTLGLPIGSFMRLKATYDLEYDRYNRDSETTSFDVPATTWVQTPGIAWEFNRGAWTLTAAARRSYRSDWKAWGDYSPPGPETVAEFPASPCDTPGSCLAEFDERQHTYDQFEYGVSKQFFFKHFQKIRFEADWQQGARLDRFSQFQFGFFGNRAHGFAGSGVRYDEGGIARAQYSFNLADVVRFDATLDYARVRDNLTADRFRAFTGLGIAGNTMGPWETIINFDIGVALASDIPDLRGETEFEIGLLKYF